MKEKSQIFKTGLEAYEKPVIEIIYFGENSILTSEVCYDDCPGNCPSHGTACDAADNCGSDDHCFGYEGGGLCSGYNDPYDCPGNCPSHGTACDAADNCGSDDHCFGYEGGGLCSGYNDVPPGDCTGDGAVCCDGVN